MKNMQSLSRVLVLGMVISSGCADGCGGTPTPPAANEAEATDDEASEAPPAGAQVEIPTEPSGHATAADETPLPDLVANGSLAGTGAEDMYRQVVAYLGEAGYRPAHGYHDTLPARHAREYPIRLDRGQCVAPVAVGGYPNHIHLSLLDSQGELAQNHGAFPGVWYCAPRNTDAELTVRVRTGRSGADYLFGLFEGENDLDLRTLLGGNCDATPGRALRFPRADHASWVQTARAWIPVRGDRSSLEEALRTRAEGATSLREDGHLVWLDVRGPDTDALLEEVDGPVGITIEAASLADASTSPPRQRPLIDTLRTVTSCHPVVMTVIVDAGMEHLPLLGRLPRLRGVSLTSSASPTPRVGPETLTALTPLSGLSLLNFRGVGVSATSEWPATFPRLRTLGISRCNGCGVGRDEIEHLTGLTRLSSLALYGPRLTARELAPFQDHERYFSVSISNRRTELVRHGEPELIFGDGVPPPPPPNRWLAALIADRVGADFWELEDDHSGAEGEPSYIRKVTRHCGEDAQRAVEAIGDRWVCSDGSCFPSEPCAGVACGRVNFDRNRVLSHWYGASDDGNPESADGLTPAQATRLRRRVECGASLQLEASFFTR